MKSITEVQKKKMARVFKRSGKTFQALASEAGLSNIPDHLAELTHDEARQLLKYCGPYLAVGKEKQ